MSIENYNTEIGDKLDCPIEIDIKRMQASIDSGFITIEGETDEEINEFLEKWLKN